MWKDGAQGWEKEGGGGVGGGGEEKGEKGTIYQARIRLQISWNKVIINSCVSVLHIEL